jgi:hypothetical protein
LVQAACLQQQLEFDPDQIEDIFDSQELVQEFDEALELITGTLQEFEDFENNRQRSVFAGDSPVTALWRINSASAATTKCSTGRAGDARDVARRLLLHLLAVLPPSGEVVIGIDDTIERRWGGKIKARGIYRDAVRSSRGHAMGKASAFRSCCVCCPG